MQTPIFIYNYVLLKNAQNYYIKESMQNVNGCIIKAKWMQTAWTMKDVQLITPSVTIKQINRKTKLVILKH
jgi:hypothetical protein